MMGSRLCKYIQQLSTSPCCCLGNAKVRTKLCAAFSQASTTGKLIPRQKVLESKSYCRIKTQAYRVLQVNVVLQNTITKGTQASPQSSKAPSDCPAQSYSELSSNDQKACRLFASEFQNECKMYNIQQDGILSLQTWIKSTIALEYKYSCYHLTDTLRVWYANLCRKIIPADEATTEASWDQYTKGTRVLARPPKDFNLWLNARTNAMEKSRKLAF